MPQFPQNADKMKIVSDMQVIVLRLNIRDALETGRNL